jgi:hypothetical protein
VLYENIYGGKKMVKNSKNSYQRIIVWLMLWGSVCFTVADLTWAGSAQSNTQPPSIDVQRPRVRKEEVHKSILMWQLYYKLREGQPLSYAEQQLFEEYNNDFAQLVSELYEVPPHDTYPVVPQPVKPSTQPTYQELQQQIRGYEQKIDDLQKDAAHNERWIAGLKEEIYTREEEISNLKRKRPPESPISDSEPARPVALEEDTEQTPTTLVELTPEQEALLNSKALLAMEKIFQGNHTKEQIKSRLDKAISLYGLPLDEDYYHRTANTLVEMRQQTGVDEMDILTCMIELSTSGLHPQFQEGAAICAVMVKKLSGSTEND